jgi:hypothetical protein
MAVGPWTVCRVVVLGALALAHVLVTHTHPDAATAARVHQGLLGWDAGWYQAIAAHGYGGAGHLSLRFWPLLPLLGAAVALIPGVTPGIGVLVVSNVAQLAGLALLGWLVADDLGDDGLARRTVWLAALAPAAFVSVMGYAEPVLLVTSVAALAAARRRRWWWAAAAGVAAGMARPLGLALVAPIVVEATRPWWERRWAEVIGRHRRRSGSGAPGAVGDAADGGVGPSADRGLTADRGTSGLVGRLVAVVAPAVGFGSLLVWSAVRYGDGLAPIRIQEQPRLHGHLADPIATVLHDLHGLLSGHHLDEGLHVPWVALAVVLLVVAARRLPASYTVLAAAILVAALSGTNLDSFERYALSAFPLVIAGATLDASPRVERTVLALATAGLAAYALMAFMNVLVP